MQTAEQKKAADAEKKADDAVEARFEKTKIQVVTEISLATLHNYVVSAIESGHGVRYWARVDVGEHKPGWENYFTATFDEVDESTGEVIAKHTLSVDKLVAGLKVLHEKYPWHYADIIKDSGDATTGDVLVQCALIGDIKYG